MTPVTLADLLGQVPFIVGLAYIVRMESKLTRIETILKIKQEKENA